MIVIDLYIIVRELRLHKIEELSTTTKSEWVKQDKDRPRSESRAHRLSLLLPPAPASVLDSLAVPFLSLVEERDRREANASQAVISVPQHTQRNENNQKR